MTSEENKEDTGAKLEKEEAKKEEAESNKDGDEAAKKGDNDEKKKEEPQVDPKVIDAVAERLNFFFSDANIRQDKFIRRFLMSDRSDYPHQVTVESLLRFNTIKVHTTDPAVVVHVAKTDSKLCDKLVVSKDEKAIGLVDPFTSSKMDGHVPLTLFVDNLPLVKDKDDAYAVTSQQVRELFEQYGPIAIVKLQFHMVDDDDHDDNKDEGGDQDKNGDDDDNNKKRRYSDHHHHNKYTKRRRVASGSALVEFESAESLEKAAADVVTLTAKKEGDKEDEEEETVEPKRKLNLNDNDLVIMTFKDYRNSKKCAAAENNQGGGGNNDGDRDYNNNNYRGGGGGEEPFTMDWKKGCVIRLKGLPKDCDREAILGAIARFWDVDESQLRDRKTYVDYSRGQEDGAVRFPESEGLADLCSKIDSGDVVIAGNKVQSAHILEGDEEEKYYKDFIEFKNRSIRHRADERRHGSRHRYKNKRQRRN